MAIESITCPNDHERCWDIVRRYMAQHPDEDIDPNDLSALSLLPEYEQAMAYVPPEVRMEYSREVEDHNARIAERQMLAAGQKTDRKEAVRRKSIGLRILLVLVALVAAASSLFAVLYNRAVLKPCQDLQAMVE